jgi:hypothetical protein
VHPNFGEFYKGEVELRRIPIPRTRVNRALSQSGGQERRRGDARIAGYYGCLMYKVRGLVLVVYIRNTLRHRDGAKRRAGAK